MGCCHLQCCYINFVKKVSEGQQNVSTTKKILAEKMAMIGHDCQSDQ